MHLTRKDKHRLKVKGRKMIFQANAAPKQAGIAILIPDEADFKPKLVTRDKVHFILIKRTIHRKDVTIINICAQNIHIPNFIKETLLNIKSTHRPPTQ
jgi:hypothetical protein